MTFTFTEATSNDAEIIGLLVVDLTSEISEVTQVKHFSIDINETIQRCRDLIIEGHYAAILCFSGGQPIAVATIAETYALYAGGKIGVIQEFYVAPEFRSSGVGAMLIEKVRDYGRNNHWACIELCTPPLPAFDRTVSFYQRNGLTPVGGRKMRQNLDENDQ
ncbi:GNAT family N-acetyltransferase [Gammaproteobacteria bacterium 45_16_T64]|nr:GNAT family N-acetyltransferase [Gammaproteobacteria bacterium 45_16_T64]